MDFKDFPIFAVENETFSDEILQVHVCQKNSLCAVLRLNWMEE